jgi:hypothetical protein
VIIENNKAIGVPEKEDFYLPDAMADKTIEWLHSVRAHDSSKPWFTYFSTGCSHAPHQVRAEWANKYKGAFDQGWDKLREETFERQKQLGVIPAGAELTPRPDQMPAWDSLNQSTRARTPQWRSGRERSRWASCRYAPRWPSRAAGGMGSGVAGTNLGRSGRWRARLPADPPARRRGRAGARHPAQAGHPGAAAGDRSSTLAPSHRLAAGDLGSRHHARSCSQLNVGTQKVECIHGHRRQWLAHLRPPASLVIRRLSRESWRPAFMPSDMAGCCSLVRIVSLFFRSVVRPDSGQHRPRSSTDPP